jgi:AmiR/NasT family two-component response regulator
MNSAALYPAVSQVHVELLAPTHDILEDLDSGLRCLGFAIICSPADAEKTTFRVRVVEEGVIPPADGVPFVVVAKTRAVERFAAAIEAGASGYFIRPLEFLSLGAALCAAAIPRSSMPVQQTSRFTATLTEDQTINTVVGMLMERFRTPRAEAYARLRRHSRDGRRKLADVATEIINVNERLSTTLRSIETIAFDP